MATNIFNDLVAFNKVRDRPTESTERCSNFEAVLSNIIDRAMSVRRVTIKNKNKIFNEKANTLYKSYRNSYRSIKNCPCENHRLVMNQRKRKYKIYMKNCQFFPLLTTLTC